MLYWNTVNDTLKEGLLILMKAEEFNMFRLVGGTSLSLQIGHRISVDLDLFTDEPHRSIDFDILDSFLKNNFQYFDCIAGTPFGLGRSYFIGGDKDRSFKLDVYYTDTFIQPIYIEDNIRLSTIEEIVAMKIDVISRKGRKKDFWDIHELLEKYTIPQMIALHKLRYPITHDESHILKNLTDFTFADDDFDPICLRGKYWELIKLDIIDALLI